MNTVELPDWLKELRRIEIVNRVKTDPRSLGNSLLGLDMNAARLAIGNGQADFDAPCGDLSEADLALLYAYLLQKGHLEELLVAFRQLFKNPARPDHPIVLDIGCGPFTGGFAFAGALGKNARFDYVGIDRAASMRALGDRLACSDLVPLHGFKLWAADLNSVDWRHPPGWRDVVVIISYLFASPTLNHKLLFHDLSCLLDRFGRGAVTLLYTNSTKEMANRQYPRFRKKLEEVGFHRWADATGKIDVKRSSRSRERLLNYALFHRPARSVLPLGK